MTIGDSLKRFRKQIGLSQTEIAERIGIAQQVYYRYESGRNMPSAEVILKLADAYNVSTDYLLGRSDAPNYEVADKLSKIAVEFCETVQALNRISE